MEIFGPLIVPVRYQKSGPQIWAKLDQLRVIPSTLSNCMNPRSDQHGNVSNPQRNNGQLMARRGTEHLSYLVNRTYCFIISPINMILTTHYPCTDLYIIGTNHVTFIKLYLGLAKAYTNGAGLIHMAPDFLIQHM